MKLIECPRDAMQGLHEFVPTHLKIEYINQLLQVGFDTIDFGSFVSPKAIPQMRDTAEVLKGLNLGNTTTKLLAIVANIRGAETAADFPEIDYLGYPLSVSETFQLRNTNKSISDALNDLAEIQEICESNDKQLVVYLSMGFGNPYGDPYEMDMLQGFVDRLDALEVDVISVSDTIGVATPDQIVEVYQRLVPSFPHIEFGAHLHSNPVSSVDKISAVINSGLRRMDGALLGFGGCPMAKDELVGNMNTEVIIETLNQYGIPLNLNNLALQNAKSIAKTIFIQ